MFTAYITKHPGCIVIDVGAQIGQYTLFAAKLGSHVIAVEPFHENILRIHKAASINRLHSKITLVANAISNKRNEIKLLQRVEANIGGQSLLDNNHLVFSNNAEARRNKSTGSSGKRNVNEYLVETILFDDLLDHLPRKSDVDATSGGFYGRAIMKIDIEGFEPYAFQHARNLFKVLDFQIIFMEWGVMNRYGSELRGLIIQMMNFLYANDLQPYVFDEAGIKQLLNRDEWTKWPWDIFWEKNAVM
jgi:FkbM family methyltransferase